MGQLFNLLLVQPIVNILVTIYLGLLSVHVPYALGFAIILLTVLIRLILYPLTASQIKASKKMQEVNPHIAKLREKHKGDAKRLQEETMRVYKEFGINPAAGCLPVLIQLPVIWSLYAVLQRVVGFRGHETLAEINSAVYFPFLKLSKLWDSTFFGLPLGQTPSHLITTVSALILLVPVMTGVLQFLQSKMMFSQPAGTPTIEKKKKNEPDFSQALQTQSLYVFPIMIGFLSYSFPIGLSLYWNTFTIFGIIQQYRIQGLGGLKAWVALLPAQTPEKKK